MCRISIIIPVYKVEQYLRKCIDSVLAQTFTDFECILVNDGSPDSSPAICDEYAKKDERIKVIHKKNGGVSSARNAGLDIAKGDWIGFVDSDDWPGEKFLEFMYNNAIKHNADVSICGIYELNNEIILPLDKRVHDDMLTSKQAVSLLFDRKFSLGGFSFNKLIKRQIIEKNRFRYDETINFMEDVQFFYNVFNVSGRIYYSSKPHYFYRRTDTSVTYQTGFTSARSKAITVMDKLYKSEPDFEIQRKIFRCKIFFIYCTYLGCILGDKKDDEFKKQAAYLKKHVFDWKMLPISYLIKIFVIIYLPFVILPYLRINVLLRNCLKFCINFGRRKS